MCMYVPCILKKIVRVKKLRVVSENKKQIKQFQYVLLTIISIIAMMFEPSILQRERDLTEKKKILSNQLTLFVNAEIQTIIKYISCEKKLTRQHEDPPNL